MKQKILVIGATGMAGHMIYLYLNQTKKYELYNITYRTALTQDSILLDVSNRDKLETAIDQINPDIIINCVGVLIKGSLKHPENAVFLNAYFPHLLKSVCDKIGAKLIHISTDCVFSGKKGHYNETDFCDADDIYGRSKALGEIINETDLTIRTSIIGPELKSQGEGLFHWFMHQKGTINGFKTAIWGGVTTLELAKAIDKAIDQNKTGLVQLSNGIAISKYDLLCLFKKIWKNDVMIIPVDGNGIDKSIAKSNKFDYDVPGYNEMLREQKRWMDINKSIYDHCY